MIENLFLSLQKRMNRKCIKTTEIKPLGIIDSFEHDFDGFKRKENLI